MSMVYLVPSLLHEDGVNALPAYILESVKKCKVIFAENERTTRRFLKKLDHTIVIDSFEWFTIDPEKNSHLADFKKKVAERKDIAIISEAGCPGVADPGQEIISVAQQLNCTVKPLVGPSSILLALMASGMNGQQFEFVGYLPIASNERDKKIRELDEAVRKTGSTKIFIETPYRNNQLFESLLNNCNAQTLLCVGINITGPNEKIVTKPVVEWKKYKQELHKVPVIFLLGKAS
ncbi:MAG: SAM-dependent methyltransferase [Chitinophagaceae bacterium]|nr:MAG: SAM-dependent methyltransferase [Chitinophagaceae bacterium]